MPIIKYKYIASQDDYNEDSIGSAGSLANRSNKSQGRGQELWEDEEDVLTGIFCFLFFFLTGKN